MAGSLPVCAQSKLDVPAGRYRLDPTHASLLWRISHFGLSNYTARFTRFDVQLDFDPADLARSSAQATIDMASIETDYPPGFNKRDWNGDLRSERFFNVAKFREATWRSTKVQSVEGNRMRVAGDLALLGVSAPVPLEVTLNAGFRSRPPTNLPTIGFSARGTLDRRMFGMLTPPPPTPPEPGVSASVEIIIEAEFILPA
ncbi:MAG: YceI family protein [Rhodocyclaceae bacterium]|nr:YceI family protein [Rhodocyclaceae bacterium]MCA4901288.1 YceI family protein [Rhodocyclaceae bacterium]